MEGWQRWRWRLRGAEQRVAVLVHVQRMRVGLLLGYYGGGAVIIDDRENKISVFFVSY